MWEVLGAQAADGRLAAVEQDLVGLGHGEGAARFVGPGALIDGSIRRCLKVSVGESFWRLRRRIRSLHGHAGSPPRCRRPPVDRGVPGCASANAGLLWWWPAWSAGARNLTCVGHGSIDVCLARKVF